MSPNDYYTHTPHTMAEYTGDDFDLDYEFHVSPIPSLPPAEFDTDMPPCCDFLRLIYGVTKFFEVI